MKNYWLYLESYSFIFEGIQGLIIYNTLNGRVVEDHNSSDVQNLIKQLMLPDSGYCTLLTEGQLDNADISTFVSDIRNTFSGDIVDVSLSEGKPFIFKPILDLLNDPDKIKEEEKYILREDVLDCLHEVNLYLGSSCDKQCNHCHSYYKQFLFCTSSDKEATLGIESYRMLFSHFSVIGLQRINLLGGDLMTVSVFHDLILLLEQYDFKVEIYTHCDFINDEFVSLLTATKNISLVILADATIKASRVCDIVDCAKQLSFRWSFIISSGMDFMAVDELIDDLCLQAEIIPFFDGTNTDFFKQNVFVNLDDILLTPVSKQRVFSRQVMNEIFYGRLAIMSNGDVYGNVNSQALGNLNVNSLNELVYAEVSKKQDWLSKRDEQPCSDCIYKLLCPSPGNYELVMKKLNLCSIYAD